MTAVEERLRDALSTRYRIERELGAGGMATVWVAQDIRHDRPVAIKVLHPELAATLGPERFLAEIKTTARLQHSHILPLLDSGEADGLLYYVMPLVEGESLRQRLERERQLPIDDAIRIAREVASALDYAHRRSVIHRDIKPENILLHEGQALVADFGIALAVSVAGGSRLTQTGLSLGTPQYMSPEQAMGERTVDARCDLYALGAVTYEMLAGEPPFTGPTVQSIVAKILTEKPARLTTYRDTVPAQVDAAVRKALAKLPADRFGSVHEFADALQDGSKVTPEIDTAVVDAGGVTSARTTALATRRGPWRTAMPWTIAAAIALVAGVREWQRAPRDVASPSARFAVPLPANARFAQVDQHLAISHDGRRLLLALRIGDTARLYSRYLDSLEFRPIPGTEDAKLPIFTPDDRWVVFFQHNKMRRMPASGGAPTDIVDAQWSGGTYAPDGSFYYTSALRSGLHRLPGMGGRSEPVTSLDTVRGEATHVYPRLFGNGTMLLFTSYAAATGSRIETLSLSSGKRAVVIGDGFSAIPFDRYLLFGRGDALHAAPFDARRGVTTGPAVPVLEQVSGNTYDASLNFDISNDGTLVYTPLASASPPRQLVWVDRAGHAQIVLDRAAVYDWPRLSPDGKRIAVSILEHGARNLWVYEIERAAMTRITNYKSSVQGAAWSPDGKQLYYPLEMPRFELYRQASDGASSEELIPAGPGDKFLSSVSPDGTTLFFDIETPTGMDMARVAVGAPGSETMLLESSSSEAQAALSPNGRWLAYRSNESGRPEIYLRSYPDLSRVRHLVSITGGEQPRWTRGGRELVFRAAQTMMSVSVDPASGTTGRPVALFSGVYTGVGNYQTTYDVTPDGDRFLMIRVSLDAPAPHVVVVLNWPQELTRKMRR